MSTSNSNLLAKNSALMFVRQMVMATIGLYTSRVILHELGVSDFGVYNLIGGIVALFLFLNTAMSSATQRHLSYEIGRKDAQKLRTYFNSSILLHILIAFVVALLAETIGRRVLFHKLDIPAERLDAAAFIFHVSVATFSLSIVQVPFKALTISHEKLSFFAYLSIFESSIKLAAAFVLKWSPNDKLETYAILVGVSTFLVLLINIGYCYRSFPECRVSNHADKAALRKLASFSSWTLFGSMAVVFRTQITNIFLNWFGGVRANAAMGVTSQLSNTLNSLVANFQIAFTPQLTKAFARGDKAEVSKLISQTTKISFSLLFVGALPFLFGTPYFLRIWLGTPPPFTAIFCRLNLVQLLVESVSAPLWICVQASGNIKKYQVVVSALILSNLPASYFLLQRGFPIYAPLCVSMGAAFILFAYRLYHVRRAFGFGVRAYAGSVGNRIGWTVAMALPAPFLVQHFLSWAHAPLVTAATAGFSAAATTLFIAFTASERAALASKARQFLNKGSRT